MLDLIITEISELLLAQPTMSGVTIRTGEKYLSENVPAPRLVWVYRKEEPYGPPKKMVDPATKLPISACFTRNAGVDAHIWGISRAQAEAIASNLVTALHRTLHGTMNLKPLQWPKSQGFLEHGMFCVQQVEVHIPVLTSFVTVPTSPPAVPEYPGGIPAGAPAIEGQVEDPDTGILVSPPSPGDAPASDEVASNPTAPAKPDGTTADYVTVVETDSGAANEIVLEQEDDFEPPS